MALLVKLIKKLIGTNRLAVKETKHRASFRPVFYIINKAGERRIQSIESTLNNSGWKRLQNRRYRVIIILEIMALSLHLVDF